MVCLSLLYVSFYCYKYVMISSPQKFDPSTTYKSVRTPNIDVIKRQVEQFKL